jgi:hypothetical protein
MPPMALGYTPRVFPALLNARDLGGHPTLDGAVTRRRSLLRADDLAQLSPAGLEALIALGGYCAKEQWKCAVLDRLQSRLREALGVIAAAGPGPLLFHCVAGKDRTGVIAALLLALADVVPSAIAADYAASAENLREAYLRRCGESDREEILEAVRCPEAAVYNMLEYLARGGGVRAYLGRIGLRAGEIARLRSRLRNTP